MDGGAWWATVHGVEKSRTQLSDFTFTFFSRYTQSYDPKFLVCLKGIQENKKFATLVPSLYSEGHSCLVFASFS